MNEQTNHIPAAGQDAGADRRLRTEERIIEVLRTVYDPEIPVNIYDLGLIYRIELDEAGTARAVDMTLTAPSCPAADFEAIDGIQHVDVQLVFEPEWSQDMMSEEARLELGLM